MAGIFDKLKSVFIVEDPNAAKQAAEKGNEQLKKDQEKIDSEPSVPAHDITIDVNNTTPPPSGKPDQKFIDILLKAVEKSNIEGFDYLEYKSSLQSLSSMDMDDETRYKSALAMAKTMGATPEKLISTANHYLTTLSKEKNKFQEALKGQKAKQVTGKETSIKKMSAAIEKKKERIQQLQKEIEADAKKVEEMKENINQAVAKVQKTSDNFHYAYSIVTGQILSDVENMKKYLGS